jgi:hypothetical protein
MALQYISDNSGNHTAVVIPIEEWNNITALHEDLKDLENEKVNQKRKPSDFIGSISKETAKKMILDIKQSRNEWERNS